MEATITRIVLVAERRASLRALDSMVRAALADAARHWGLAGDRTVELTPYHDLYARVPRIGGHWTLFSAHLDEQRHEVATVTVAAEFEGDALVDLIVSSEREVVAGGIHALALREALQQCGGPLRQVTPLPACPRPAAASGVLSALLTRHR